MTDAYTQLYMAIKSEFQHWSSSLSLQYRALAGIPLQAGTGVIVQSMVFGNCNKRSGSG